MQVFGNIAKEIAGSVGGTTSYSSVFFVETIVVARVENLIRTFVFCFARVSCHKIAWGLQILLTTVQIIQARTLMFNPPPPSPRGCRLGNNETQDFFG
jgi:hypothetical protein